MYKSFDTAAEIPFQDVPQTAWLWGAKILGAVLGSAISIVYVLPKARREAAIRFIVGVIIGIIFGPTIGAKLTIYLELTHEISKIEIVLMGSTFASLSAWWGLGILQNFLQSQQFGKAIRK